MRNPDRFFTEKLAEEVDELRREKADLLAALSAVSARPRKPDEWIDEVRATIAAARGGGDVNERSTALPTIEECFGEVQRLRRERAGLLAALEESKEQVRVKQGLLEAALEKPMRDAVVIERLLAALERIARMQPSLTGSGSVTPYSIARAAIAAAHQGERPLTDHSHINDDEVSPHMGRMSAAHDGYVEHLHPGDGHVYPLAHQGEEGT